MSDNLNGIFDGGFSGLIYEGNRKPTMPDFLDKLAEEQSDIEVQQVEAPEFEFTANVGLSRASELSNDESRAVENKKVEAKDFKKQIEDMIGDLLSTGHGPKEIEKVLNRKFPSSQVKRYFEANSEYLLEKFAETALDFLGKKSYKECLKLEEAVRSHKQKLKKESALNVLSSFCDWTRMYKKMQERTDPENKAAFKRNETEEKLAIRDIDNQVKKNAKQEKEKRFAKMWTEYKQFITAKKSKKAIHKILVGSYSLSEIDSFYKKYAKQINNLYKFENRNDFQTDFGKVDNTAKIRDFEFENKRKATKESILHDAESLMKTTSSTDSICRTLEKKYGNIKDLRKIVSTHIKTFYSKKSKTEKQKESDLAQVKNVANIRNDKIENRKNYNDKPMLSMAFDLMTRGSNLKDIKTTLKKSFGIEDTTRFMKENSYRLSRHYGQLGYIFIDSNIYDNCDIMKQAFTQLTPIGKKLVLSVKANKKCKGCNNNKQGTCQKVGLLISNHPLIRSSRAVRRVLKKAEQFAPGSYINEFRDKISSDSNTALVTEFVLGLGKAISRENKNIGKKANFNNAFSIQQGFEKTDSFSIDPFKKVSKSSIIDDVLEGV